MRIVFQGYRGNGNSRWQGGGGGGASSGGNDRWRNNPTSDFSQPPPFNPRWTEPPSAGRWDRNRGAMSSFCLIFCAFLADSNFLQETVLFGTGSRRDPHQRQTRSRTGRLRCLVTKGWNGSYLEQVLSLKIDLSIITGLNILSKMFRVWPKCN